MNRSKTMKLKIQRWLWVQVRGYLLNNPAELLYMINFVQLYKKRTEIKLTKKMPRGLGLKGLV